MVIHTRIHRYCSVVPERSSVADQAWGELKNRWQISSLDEVEQRTEEWARVACSLAHPWQISADIISTSKEMVSFDAPHCRSP
jgi:hypothetical protein